VDAPHAFPVFHRAEVVPRLAAIAGGITGMLAHAFMLAPAAGVIGFAGIFRHGMVPAADDATYLRLLFDFNPQNPRLYYLRSVGCAVCRAECWSIGGSLMKPLPRKDGDLGEYLIPLAIYSLIGSMVNYLITVSEVAYFPIY